MAVQRWTDEMLDELAHIVEEQSSSIREQGAAIREQSASIKQQAEEAKELGIRFSAYQQSSQWVVNLAFGLLASATLTTIITSVFRR
jgi:methyl-accepting chemotaxis protein